MQNSKVHTDRKSVGVWIDHRTAVLVFVSEKDKNVVHIASHVEKHPSREGDSPTDRPFEAQSVPADDTHQRRFSGNLARFYDEIIAKIAGTEAIFVCGPGEAKGELGTRLEKAGLAGRALTLEPAERMSDKQLVHRVSEHFGLSHGVKD